MGLRGTYRTLPTLLVLSALLGEPSGEMYGLQLMERTGRGSGTIYAILSRLKAEGMIEGRQEDVDPKTAGRPARRLYRLTDDGRAQAEAAATLIRGVLAPRGEESP